MDRERIFEYNEETSSDKLKRKTQESPMMVAGLIGFALVVGVGIYKFKTRPPTVSASLYLTQLRVISQGMVVGALTGGMIYQIGKDLLGGDTEEGSK